MKPIPEVHPLVVPFALDCVSEHAAQNALVRVEMHVKDAQVVAVIHVSQVARMDVPTDVKIRVLRIAQTDARDHVKVTVLQHA